MTDKKICTQNTHSKIPNKYKCRLRRPGFNQTFNPRPDHIDAFNWIISICLEYLTNILEELNICRATKYSPDNMEVLH